MENMNELVTYENEKAIKAIRATFSLEEIKKAYLKDLKGGGFFISTRELFGLDEPLILILNIPGSGEYRFRGKVAWHRRPRAWDSTLPSGIGFLPDKEEHSKLEFVLNLASGIAKNRRNTINERLPAVYPVRLKIKDTWISATTINVGPNGMLLSCRESIEEGRNLSCVVYTDNSPRPVECNVIIERTRKVNDSYIVAVSIIRTTPVIRQALCSTSIKPEKLSTGFTFTNPILKARSSDVLVWTSNSQNQHRTTLPYNKK